MVTPPSSPTAALVRVPRVWAALGFLLVLGGVALLFLGRKAEALRPPALMAAAPGFYQHVSNFCLSYLLYAGSGYMFLMAGGRGRALAWAGVALVMANVLYEGFLPILNTRDPVDALYGVAGVAFGGIVLWVLDRWGLVANPQASVTAPDADSGDA